MPGLPDALIGLGIGTIFGKLVVRRLERRHGHLDGRRVRHIETIWIAIWVAVAIVLRAAAELS